MPSFSFCRCLIFLALSFTLFPLEGVTDRQWDLLKKNFLQIELAPTRSSLKENGKLPFPTVFGVDAAPVVTEEALGHISSLIQPDGSFTGIDYANKGRSVWKVLIHLDYCRMLAIARHTFPENIQKKYRIPENCLAALDWWLEKKPTNPNWWNNDVYVCQMLGNIALLLPEKELTAERMTKLTDLLKKSKPNGTGQNLLWMSWNSLLAGMVTRDGKRLEDSLKAIESAIVPAPPGKEGIQPDMSFQQHGAHLYQGNYGRHFLHSAAKYIKITQETPWASKEKKALVEKLLLDGTRWMCSGNLLDYSTWGRQISYNDRPQGPDLYYVCLNLLSSSPLRREEIQSFTASLYSPGREYPSSLAEGSPAGTRAFPISDYIVHRSHLPRYMTSVKLSSKRTVVGEECNGDNLLGCYLSDGCMLTYSTGMEYDLIFPCWDWTCIPGTTAERGFLPPWKQWSGKRGGSEFAGALDAGVAGMVCQRFDLSARKSWFFLQDRIICLGSGITKNNSGQVLTTVEQSLLKKSAVEENIPILKQGKCQSVTHAGTLYLFPPDHKLVLETGKRTGSWKDIRSGSSDATVEKDVFLLAVSHGESPENSSYLYQVLPGQTTNSSPDKEWEKLTVLKHDKTCHAIAFGKTVKMVFFEAGEINLPNGKTLSVPEPCLISLSEKGKISAMIPGKREGSITLTIQGKTHNITLDKASR